MKSLASLALAVGLLAAPAYGINLHKRTDSPARVVGFPIQRKHIQDPVSRDQLRRRAETVQVPLDNEETLYFANGTLGTPAQAFRLHLDTGSSDLWVNTPSSALCTSKGSPCAISGTYVANSSSTYQYISSDFNITYVDGSGSSGDYASDTFTIGGTTISQLQFGIGYESTSEEGILGIGYQINEVQAGRLGKAVYNNLPAALVADSKIKSNAYSLWLNDLSASTGSILFGGVDTDQYHGTLETLPVQTESGQYAEFLITLTALALGSTVIANGQALAVLLDSGSSLTYLPDTMVSSVYEQTAAVYNSDQGAAYVPCSLATNDTTLDFTFTSVTISVTMNELIIPYSSGPFPDGTPACLFGLAPAGSGTSVLGDTFLRSAYVVYDLDNNEISLAQTNFNATSSNVVEIGTGSSAVPDASAVANPATATEGAGSGQIEGPLVVGSSTSSSAAERTPPPAVLGAMAAVGAGIVYAAM
ncbi:hypothetical protein OIDMADRAFT_60096 [Oidiodendron maius Zn]|uniref:Probable aspartic-type endopeptidase OPSB n=1 Tax=Oidiodendron maius (strain Zn) TaxID=913774 RepID=A0A0C3C7P0_OIDMZ|nr:hypothetical protein OIDMADRAFT_60096 [Oidiodendron maius Zn]